MSQPILGLTNPSRAMIDSVPPIASREEVERVLKNVYSFFVKRPRLSYSLLPSNTQYFVNLPVTPYKMTEEEEKEVTLFSRRAKKRMFQWLAEHPSLCRQAVQHIPMRHFRSNKRKSFYYDLMQIAFYSDSLDLFKLVTVDTVQPPPKKMRKNPMVPILSYIERSERIPGLYIRKESEVAAFRHSLSEVPTTTAMAATPTELFVGKQGGLIRIVTEDGDNGINVRSVMYRSVGNDPYSLCWVHGNLWMITHTHVFKVNCMASEVTELEDKPKRLSPPTCTDGHYFYSLRAKKFEVSVFQFDSIEERFVAVKTVKLSCGIGGFTEEHIMSLVTDGGLICLGLQRKKDVTFKHYSLVTGKMVAETSVAGLPKILCWCTRPFSNEHVVLYERDLVVYSAVIQIPKWMLGVGDPTPVEGKPIQNALELAMFHGAPFFVSSWSDELAPLLNHYCASGDDSGVRIIGQILLRLMEGEHAEKNAGSCIQFFADYYAKCANKPIMQRFCCVMYLACLADAVASIKPNILSEYLETHVTDLDFVFVFPRAVKFSEGSLSAKAMDNLIGYCASVWWDYQYEASYLIQEYLRNTVDPRFQEGKIGGLMDTLQKIMDAISRTIEMSLRGSVSPERFTQSGQFLVWEYILTMVRTAKPYWQRFGHRLISLLQLAIIDQNSNRTNVGEIKNMMNRTLVVFLELLFAIPKNISYVRFETAQKFYEQFPDVIEGYDPELDQLIVDLLDNSYDVCDETEYASFFHQIRGIIMFAKRGDKTLLMAIRGYKSYSSRGIVEYLKDGNTSALAPVCDPNIVGWCLNKLYTMKPLLTIEQKIITAVFITRLKEIYPGDAALAMNLDPKMFYAAQLYFMLPRVLLLKYESTITSDYVMKLPTEMLQYCFDNIVMLYNRITKPEHFRGPMARALVKQSLAEMLFPVFADAQQEPEHFREALLWLLPIEAGVRQNTAEYATKLRNYIWGGSCRTVDVIMQGVTFVENCGMSGLEPFFDVLFEIVVVFLTHERNPFVVQKTHTIEPSLTFFTIIHYMRKMFNSSSGLFRSYLLKYAETCTDENAIVIFAVLNNAMEAPRKRVEVHFTYDSVDVSGVIDNVYPEQLSMSVNKTSYSLTKAQNLWCKPQEMVDLTLIRDVAVIGTLFTRVSYTDDVLNVFYYAALVDFFKTPHCRKTLPRQFLHDIAKMRYPKALQVESYVSTFLFYLQMAFTSNPPFCFTELADCQYVLPSLPISSNCRLADEGNWNRGGVLMALDDPIRYVSCPIHPKCVMKIKLTIFPSEIPKKYPSLMVSVFGTSRCTPCVTKTDVFKVNAKREDPVRVIVSFRPKRRLITVAIDWNVVMATAVSPSIDMLCLVLDLQPGVMIEYEYVYSTSIQNAETAPDCFAFKETDVKLMSAAGPDPPVPVCDSSVYNRFQLLDSARHLIENFKFLLIFYDHVKSRRRISPRFALRLLLSINPFPADEALTLENMPCKNIWMGYGKKFLRFLQGKQEHFTQEALTDKFVRVARGYCGQLIRNDNHTALFMRSKQTVHMTNSFVFCSSLTTPLQTVGFTSQYISPNSGCMVIPLDNVTGSVVEVVIAARHYMTLSIAKGNYDFAVVLESFQKIKESLPFTAPLFHKMIEMIHAVSPPIPAPFTFPVFRDVSFLIPESNIHKHPGQYLLPRYIDCVVDPHVFHSGMPASFAMKNSSAVYFAIRQTAPVDRELVFEVTEVDGTVHTMVPNTFLLLKHGEFTVNCSDRSGQVDSVEFILCFEPDVSSVNEALQHWKPHYSHQLLLSVPVERQLTAELYKVLPLSTRFSFETAKFVMAILRSQDINSCLMRYQNHVITQQQTRTKTGLIRCPKISFAQVETDAGGAEAPASIDYCRKVANMATLTPERKEYLVKNNLDIYSIVDADQIRVGNIQGANVSQLRAQITQSIRAISEANPVETWLHKIIQKMPHYVLLMFLECLTGRWGPRALFGWPKDGIYLYYVTTPDKLEFLQGQNILVVGQFSSEVDFRRALLACLQDYSDRLFAETED